MTNLKLRTYNGDLIPVASGQRLSLEETREYEVVFDGDTEACQVFWGNVLLEPDSRGRMTIRPGYWVGDAELKIEGPAESLTVPVRVQPREEKLSDSLWVAMLQDLETWLPGVSTGIEGGKDGQVGETGASVPLIAEALIPVIAAFERAIRAILEFPRRLDVSVLNDVPLRMVRRVDRETLKWVSRHPEFHAHLDPWQSIELTGQQPILPQRKTIDILDHPANRYISWLIRRVENVLRKTADGLESASTANPTDDNVFWCHSRAKLLREGADRIFRLWRSTFLSSIPNEPLSEAALLVVLDDPAYTRIHKIGRLFINPLFQFDNDATKPQASVRPSFSIYELWCFLAVGKQLNQLLPDWKYVSSGMKHLLGHSATGEGALHRLTNQYGDEIEVLFNASFAGYFNRSDKLRWSISSERRPDIIVSFKPNQEEGKWISLDAKYRVGRNNLSDAFSSAHIYKDSLRYDGFGGQCLASVLLSPSRSEDSADWFSSEYLEIYHEGIWELKPGIIGRQVGEWLVRILLN